MDKSAPTTYSIHDIWEQTSRINTFHGIATAQAAALKRATGKEHPVWNLGKALKSIRTRYARHVGHTSKYPPHQGAKEKARRLRQMERGNV